MIVWESRAEPVLTQLVQQDELQLQRYKLQALKLKKVKGNTFNDLIDKVAMRHLDNWNCAYIGQSAKFIIAVWVRFLNKK